MLQSLVDHVPAMLAYWSAEQRCVFANRAYETWFGVTPEALIGRNMKDLLGEIYPLNLPYILGALDGESQQFEREIPDPGGGPPRYSQAHYIPDIVDGVVRGFYVLVADITTRRRLEQELRQANALAEALATQDCLTGLPNRIQLEDYAGSILEAARREQCAGILAFIDMDGFKAINDAFGHAGGDRVLRGVAERLRGAIRSFDTAARIGGDEFVVMLPGVADEAAAVLACERLLRAVTAAPFKHGELEINCSFSVGVVLFPRDGDDLRTLLVRADDALYAAKRAGKNQWALYRPPHAGPARRGVP